MVSALLVLVACGSRSGIDEGAGADRRTERLRTGGEGNGAPVIPRRCVEDWQTLYEDDSPWFALQPALALAGQELLFSVVDDVERELRALDLAAPGGRYRVVNGRIGASELWVEDEDVLLWWAGRLFRVPLSGGAAALELGMRGDAPSAAGVAVVLQPDVVYWTELGDEDQRVSLWRQPRPGTERELVAWLDDVNARAEGLAIGDGYAVVTDGARAVAVALAGGAETPLAPVAEGAFTGVDALGVYLSRPANRTRRGGRALEYEILRSPVDGGAPIRFWRGAAGEFIGSLWPHGGGWLATGRHYRSDGRPHAVVLYVAGDGSTHQLACAPDAEHRSSVARS